MVRTVDRDYLVQLLDQYYYEQEENCLLCGGRLSFQISIFRKKIKALISDVSVWKISYYENDPSIVTVFPAHKDE